MGPSPEILTVYFIYSTRSYRINYLGSTRNNRSTTPKKRPTTSPPPSPPSPSSSSPPPDCLDFQQQKFHCNTYKLDLSSYFQCSY
ncbi:hypothetical protein SeMB42_g07695 [Synchytrium endobioticum]|uniref:Uncharacterized protein n=1 Tax=Synchytrium endobioticum TaxID=286115 RepID=A0A507C185_9FUNG|nr:hypothetical protein SeMB42_g07695 [Synchytrium endobioticum]